MNDKERYNASEMIEACKRAKEVGVSLLLTRFREESVDIVACSSSDPAVIAGLANCERTYLKTLYALEAE